MLEELERLTEGLVERARASHDPALGLSLRMNEARRSQQQLTRRMMATVSELSLYQVGAGGGGRRVPVTGWPGGILKVDGWQAACTSLRC